MIAQIDTLGDQRETEEVEELPERAVAEEEPEEEQKRRFQLPGESGDADERSEQLGSGKITIGQGRFFMLFFSDFSN